MTEPPAVAVEDLSFGYSKQPILAGFGAEFARGSMSALVGKSGSGKSTLLYILGLMVTPWSGRLSICGEDVTALSDAERSRLRARTMGFVFQDALLDPARSVLDNVLEPALYRDRTERLRDQALGLLEQFEVSVDPDRKPGQISGGQAQRVALCRAFLGGPRIILADEPTGNLDDETATVVWDALREHADAGAAVVIATHDAERARLCDAVIRIGHGA